MALREILIAIAIVAACAGLIAWVGKMPHVSVQGNMIKTVTIGEASIQAEIVDTESARELGLGGRDSLPVGQGMLFVFGAPGPWGFWMKDMRFPIDILWARADGTVTTIARNVSPDTYPKSFLPKSPDALYVLELPAGASAEFSEGDILTISRN